MISRCFFHFRTREGDKLKIESRGGVTVCVTTKPIELDMFQVSATSAICSLEDGFNKEEGRTKSAGRMVSLQQRFRKRPEGDYELPKKQFAVVRFIHIDDSLAKVAQAAAHLAINKLSLRSKTEEEMAAIKEELLLGVGRTLAAWKLAKVARAAEHIAKDKAETEAPV